MEALCHTAGVSLCLHAIREEHYYEDYLLLKSIYDAHRGKVGYRPLYMALAELLETPMNRKKILYRMNKFNLAAKIRRENPYKKRKSHTGTRRLSQSVRP